MTRLVANVTAIAFAGVGIAAALSLRAFGSAGSRPEGLPGGYSVLRAGEECTNHGDACAAGTRCTAVELGRHRFLCLPVAKLGEACGPATGGCEEPAFCDDDLHCVLGNAGLGQACTRHAECKAPLVCPWARHVCSAPAKIGRSCHTNPGGRSECAAGAGCNGTRCVTRKPDGQACLADEECTAGVCQQGGCGQATPPSFAERGSAAN